ncbi:BglG family transcription antiterminator [Lactococcus piscium]|uniref:BglG family transcription antiterminator n=1 Tax=Pseudolactococcus piscium TaxID=1364 RepID=A0A2A5S633_9LACT|nr:PRD domain-containing protein [Lactococcus piscium]PCS08912.1 BglG family transcription antiterminator [Lactococcus piscium]
MKIKKVLNNNVVIASETETGQEKIVMSNGLGFNNSIGDEIDKTDSQKIFVLSDDVYQKYVTLTQHIDPKASVLAEKIISYAQEQYHMPLNEIIHLTLTDHVDSVLSRVEVGQLLTNKLTLEISRIYEKEFQIGQYARQLISEMVGKEILADEAAFIALHILNNRIDLDESEKQTNTTVKFISDIVKVVETYFQCQYDETSFSYYRFVMHLKGLVKRLGSSKFKDDNTLFETMVVTYPEAAKCAIKVEKMIFLKYHKGIGSEEKAYLILYIEKLNREKE